MSIDFDRFIAGEGRLAGVLRAQPGFEPPVGMEARLFTLLDALDTQDTPAGFEPPPELEAAVMAEAERLDAAQRPRRNALLAAAARGDDSDIADLGPAAQRWLRAQTPAQPATRRRTPRWPWLTGLGSAVAAVIALSVAVQLWFDPQATQVTHEADEETAAAVAPSSPTPSPAGDAAPLSPVETRPQREAKRADFARARSEPAYRPPAMAALQDRAEPVGRTIAPMAKVQPAPSAGDPVSVRAPQHAPRELGRAQIDERAAREAPRAPSAVIASPQTPQSAQPTGRASAPLAKSAAPASTHAAAPTTRAIAPEPDTPRQDGAEDSTAQEAIRFLMPLTTSTAKFVARISAYPSGRWQVSVTPADRSAAQTLIDDAAQQLAGKGRRDRFVLVDASRTAGTLQVELMP